MLSNLTATHLSLSPSHKHTMVPWSNRLAIKFVTFGDWEELGSFIPVILGTVYSSYTWTLLMFNKYIFTYCAMSLQSCVTLCDSTDCSPPGSSAHGFLQARILEWVAMPSSTGSSWPRDQKYVSCNGKRVILFLLLFLNVLFTCYILLR